MIPAAIILLITTARFTHITILQDAITKVTKNAEIICGMGQIMGVTVILIIIVLITIITHV